MTINLYRFSSPTERAKKTLTGVGVGMENKLESMEGESVEEFIKEKTREMSLNALVEFPEGFDKKWYQLKKEFELQDNQIFRQFLNGERDIKPEIFAKPYIKTLGNFFKRANKKNRKVTVISFRHGDKDSKGNLSEKGEMQSQELGKKLKNELILGKNLENEGDKEWDVILAATHNVINETVMYTLFSDDKEFPEDRKKLLDFTETVTYTFYPNEQNEDESYLKIERGKFNRTISYKKFKEILEGKKGDKKTVEKSGE